MKDEEFDSDDVLCVPSNDYVRFSMFFWNVHGQIVKEALNEDDDQTSCASAWSKDSLRKLEMIAASTDLCRRTDLKRWMGFSFNWMLILDGACFNVLPWQAKSAFEF